MRLYLVQHGEAVPEEQDPARPLTERGKTEVERLGRFLRANGTQAGRVIHSGKLRARQTAEILAGEIATGVPLETSDMVHAKDPPGPFAWQSGGWDHDTLVVAHMPFLSKLVSHMVAGDETLSLVRFQPGTAVCLVREDSERWAIAWMLPPEALARE